MRDDFREWLIGRVLDMVADDEFAKQTIIERIVPCIRDEDFKFWLSVSPSDGLFWAYSWLQFRKEHSNEGG